MILAQFSHINEIPPPADINLAMKSFHDSKKAIDSNFYGRASHPLLSAEKMMKITNVQYHDVPNRFD
jgi:hypothetical protein